MGYLSRLKNIGSNILNCIKKVADLEVPTLHKVMGILLGPLSMIYPRVEWIVNTVGSFAGWIDRHLSKWW